MTNLLNLRVQILCVEVFLRYLVFNSIVRYVNVFKLILSPLPAKPPFHPLPHLTPWVMWKIDLQTKSRLPLWQTLNSRTPVFCSNTCRAQAGRRRGFWVVRRPPPRAKAGDRLHWAILHEPPSYKVTSLSILCNNSLLTNSLMVLFITRCTLTHRVQGWANTLEGNNSCFLFKTV